MIELRKIDDIHRWSNTLAVVHVLSCFELQQLSNLLAVTSTLESGSFPRFGNQVASDSDCLLVFASRDWTIPIEDLLCCLVLRKQPPRLIDITRDTGSEKGLAMVWIGATLVSIKFPSLLQRSEIYSGELHPSLRLPASCSVMMCNVVV